MNVAKEILDQIETNEYCKICYINDQPPLIRIRRERKKDTITHKFTIGKPYTESEDDTMTTERNKTHYLASTNRDLHWELGDPEECGSYWTKLPKDNTHPDQLDEMTSPVVEPCKKIYPISYLGEGVTRELCEIGVGPYAYGLTPTYITEPKEVDENSPYLPELTFGQLVIQFNMQAPNLTIRQLAITGASTWALLKRDIAIMWECRQQFKKEIAQETWECLTGYRRGDQEGTSIISQLHPSNIVLPMSYMEPK